MTPDPHRGRGNPDSMLPAGGGAPPDSTLEERALERTAGRALGWRWMGWRLRLLVVMALAGCLGIFALLRMLAAEPYVDARWRTSSDHLRIELAGSGDEALRTFVGSELLAVELPDGRRLVADAGWLQRSPRWVVSDDQRERLHAVHAVLADAMTHTSLRFVFTTGEVQVRPAPRGYAGIGAMFWLLSGLALVLYLVGAVVVLALPDPRNLLYGVMALSQTASLLLIATELLHGLGMPRGFSRLDANLRVALDLVFAAATLHATTIHPRPVPMRHAIAGAAWLAAMALLAAILSGDLQERWWWIQGAMLTSGAASIGVLTWSHRLEPHPFAIVLRRFGIVTVATLLLLTLAVAAASRQGGMQHLIASVGSVIWYVFLASLLLLAPFLSRSQQVMREFAMLAGISTVATSLDLLFVAMFALGQFASLTLALFLSLGLYAGARQWFLNQMMGSNMLTTERMFESLYRTARDVEAAPEQTVEFLARLLRELFEPLEVTRLSRAVTRTRVVGDGSTLVVPVPRLPGAREEEQATGAISLRFARRGRRMFTEDDARLTDRVLEQLARAVAHDRAVEQGRSEERARIAQDLHDDIGARLLTLMYKAQSPEMEEYVRHTLQDLKTLTRGLAASNHKLSHASAEWKADIAQRLTAADCVLGWSFTLDGDVNLGVVQWSSLTRVLRELINNVIAHAQATRVDVNVQFERGRFTLTVADDGVGRDPQSWAHGLGLGGVRKRVKLLGGEVRWRENGARGIACEVRIPQLGERR